MLNEPVLTQLEEEIFGPQRLKFTKIQLTPIHGAHDFLSLELVESEGMVMPSVKVSHLATENTFHMVTGSTRAQHRVA